MTTLIILDTAKIHHATRAKAEKLSAILAAEYPILSLHATYNEDESGVMGWMVVATIPDEEEATTIYEGTKVPDLADVLDACDDAGIDPETEIDGEEEPKASGSVVPETYRAQYRAASSNGQTCGDWLAERLVADTHSIDGFNVDEFTAILSANGVDMTTKWAQLPMSGQKGWIGRYRMNGRQVMEKIIALRGTYIDAMGNTITPHADWLETMRGKHAKWIAKQEKAAKAALNLEAA
jgi:hypothetical protein